MSDIKRFNIRDLLNSVEIDPTLVKILCYPKYEANIARYRLLSLYDEGVTSILLEGSTSIDKYRVLGKGMNSVVVKVIYRGKVAVAKLLRLDAQRKDLSSEVEVLKYINRYGLGPRLYSGGDWYLIEEYIDGEYLPAKLESLIDSGQHDDLKSLLKRILDKTYKLDVIGVDHGELSRADKHIIVSDDYDPRIIDFESSSMSRRPRNLTSIIQYIFFRYRGGILSKTLGVEYDELILELSLYKTNYSENVFRSILTKLRIKDKLEKS